MPPSSTPKFFSVGAAINGLAGYNYRLGIGLQRSVASIPCDFASPCPNGDKQLVYGTGGGSQPAPGGSGWWVCSARWASQTCLGLSVEAHKGLSSTPALVSLGLVVLRRPG